MKGRVRDECRVSLDTSSRPQNKGTRMLAELLLLLWCHRAASGDPAKLSLLSKGVGTKDE